MKFRLPAFAASFMLAASSHAEVYEFDLVHSQVMFSISHFGYSQSLGRFHASKGSLDFDGKDWTKASVQTTIDTSSLDMGNATWKEHVSDPRFLDVAKYPTMEFKSTKVEVVSESKLRVHGDLTLHGVTKPVILDTTVNKAAPHPMTKRPAAGFSATTSLKRSEYGIMTSLPNVGDDVTIRIEVESSVKKQ
ncbi:MAG TPA: YceI family protein [Steroidobacteraceae bacterium]|nr:YceI family protein [Steroidobacteraceae bacterium]